MGNNIYINTSVSEYLAGNPYPGRGILIGLSPDDEEAVMAYFIMGRSANSRNRIFVEDGEDVMICPFDESKVEDPSLIIYYPVRKAGKRTIVTNGDQTDTIFDFLQRGERFEDALRTRTFEPDGPNWTPRISGLLCFAHEDGFRYKLSILKSEDEQGSACCREFFQYEGLPGVGHMIHTYQDDGNPLPTFCGEPVRITIPENIETFTEEIWNSLDENNRISLYVRYINRKSGETESRLINKYNTVRRGKEKR